MALRSAVTHVSLLLLAAPSPGLRRRRSRSDWRRRRPGRGGRRAVRRRRDGHEFHSLSGRVDLAAEPAEAARDGDALAALVFSGRVLGRGDGGRRRLFQSVAVCGRATGQHRVNTSGGVKLGHVFSQSVMRRFIGGKERALACAPAARVDGVQALAPLQEMASARVFRCSSQIAMRSRQNATKKTPSETRFFQF